MSAVSRTVRVLARFGRRRGIGQRKRPVLCLEARAGALRGPGPLDALGAQEKAWGIGRELPLLGFPKFPLVA
jgi:hypothetical protein